MLNAVYSMVLQLTKYDNQDIMQNHNSIERELERLSRNVENLT